MDHHQSFAAKSNKRMKGILLGIMLLLLIPLIAMQFTTEVNWTLFDFLVASILLFGSGLALELMMRNVKSIKFKWLVCVLLFLLIFLIWAELAVGIIGTPFSGN